MIRWCCMIPLLAFAACTPDHPMDKPGTWSVGPYPSNDANLRAMIVNPRDLARGRGERTSLGPESAPPVTRLFAGKRKELPSTSALSILNVGQQSGGGGQGEQQ